MKCPSCNKENGADAKRCDSCGTFLGPTLSTDKPSEDEIPNHLVLAIGASILPLLCATVGGLALIAIPVGLFAAWQANSVDDTLRRKDVLGARAASINAQRFSVLAIVLAMVLSAVSFFMASAERTQNAVRRDIPTGEDTPAEVATDVVEGEAAPQADPPVLEEAAVPTDEAP